MRFPLTPPSSLHVLIICVCRRRAVRAAYEPPSGWDDPLMIMNEGCDNNKHYRDDYSTPTSYALTPQPNTCRPGRIAKSRTLHNVRPASSSRVPRKTPNRLRRLGSDFWSCSLYASPKAPSLASFGQARARRKLAGRHLGG